ncbi:hypothetical protein SEA_FRANKIE_70 [Mycobacterium phage Frankie]|nr:hypothetical protein SEA_FRANKIE_70 [Mycobacterium phage Frankie]
MSSDDTKHLWEYDHPYYCSEGNYLAQPIEHPECWQTYDSWQDFHEDWGNADPDLNLIFRWDWYAPHLEFPEDYPDGREEHILRLYLMLQRKAFNKSIYVSVTPADEPAIREFLQQRAKTIAAIWEPLVTLGSEA